jgi:hypothetical protein
VSRLPALVAGHGGGDLANAERSSSWTRSVIAKPSRYPEPVSLERGRGELDVLEPPPVVPAVC